MSLISVFGDLRRGYRQLHLDQEVGMLHVDQLIGERFRNSDLQHQRIYAADGLISFMQDGKPLIAITREHCNPLLQDLDRAVQELADNGTFRLNPKQVIRAINDPETTVIDMSRLDLCSRLERSGEKSATYCSLTVDTNNFKLQAENQDYLKLLQRLYGQRRNLARSMRKLCEAGIKQTRIYFPSPDYIKKMAQNSAAPNFALAWIWWLNSFRFDSDLIAENCPLDKMYLYGAGKKYRSSIKETMQSTRNYRF